MSKMVRVLVTGVGGLGCKVLRALNMASTPYYLIGVDASPLSIGLFDVDESYIVPPASDAGYLDTILRICNDKKVSVIVPGSDPELRVIAKFREAFIGAGVLPLINDEDTIEICLDKWKTIEFLKDRGFATPRTFLVRCQDDIRKVDISPSVIKPSVGGGGSQNVFIAQDEEELHLFCNYILREGYIPLIQEYIGQPDDEYTVGVLSDFSGELINSISIRRHIMCGLSNKIKVKNRTGREELSDILVLSSGISQGFVEEYKNVRYQCERIALALGSKGPLNIQCRLVNDRVYPFEINPRFSASTSLRALAGVNEPDILIRKYILMEEVELHFEYKKGYVMRGLIEKFIPFDEMKSTINKGSWRRTKKRRKQREV